MICWWLVAKDQLFLFNWHQCVFCHPVQNWTAFKDNLPPRSGVLSHSRSHARGILLIGTGFDSSPSSRRFSIQSLLCCLCWLDGARVCLFQDLSREAASHQRLDPDFSYERPRSLQDVNLQHVLNYFIDHERTREVFGWFFVSFRTSHFW